MDSTPSSVPPSAPRIVRGLYLGADATEDGCQPLPTSLIESVEQSNAQEEVLRSRYDLPSSSFFEPVTRDGALWDAEGAARAVKIESERLRQRVRDIERDNVSVGYARGFGFYFGLVHLNSDELAARTMLCEETLIPPSNCGGASTALPVSRDDQFGERDLCGVSDCADGDEVGNGWGERDGDDDEDNAQPADANDEGEVQHSSSTPAPAPQASVARGEAENVQPVIRGSSTTSTHRQAAGGGGGILVRCVHFEDARSNVLANIRGAQWQGPISFPRTTRCSSRERGGGADARAGAENGAGVDVDADLGAAPAPSALNGAGASSAQAQGGGNGDGAGGSGGSGPDGDDEELSDVDDEMNDDAEDSAFASVAADNFPNLQRSQAKVRNTLYQLLVDLRKALPSAENTQIDLLLHKRVAGCGLAVAYQGAVAGSDGLRTIAIYVDIAPKLRLTAKRIACVRFMYRNRADIDDSYVDSANITTSCSCSSTMGAAVCEHAEMIASSSYHVRNEIQFILSYKSRRLLSETPNACRAVFLGERKNNSKAAWLVMRHNARNEFTSNFVPVMESARGKRGGQPIERRVSCKRCRLGSCEHEDAVVKRVKELDLEKPEGDTPIETNYRFVRCASVLPRRLFPCQSDKAEIQRLGNALNMILRMRCENGEVDENGVVIGGVDKLRVNYEVWDKQRTCRNCGEVMFGDPEKRNCTIQRREVWLHTLLHGSMWIKVCDMTCPKCSTETHFDGRDCAMFASSMWTVYTREILDVLLFHLCMVGGTFREGYELMKATSNSPSAVLMRWGGFPLVCSRKKTNDAFGQFLRSIEQAPDESLRKVFTCSTCESQNSDGTTRVDAVVMDGTATGILGSLPKFTRPSIEVPAANDTASHQFLIRFQKPRKFVSYLFRLAKRCGARRSFTIEMPTKLNSEKVEHLLFCDTPEDGGIGLSTIFSILFEAPTLRRALKDRSIGANGLAKVEIFPELTRIPLRTAMSHILHAFVHESVPAGLIMSERHGNAASEMVSALDGFVNCGHFAAIPYGNPEMVCSQCCMNLAQSGENVCDLLPLIANFVNVVCEGVVENNDQPYRNLARFVANLLTCSLKVVAGFKRRFAEKQSESCRSYTELYKEPNSSAFRSEYSELIKESEERSENIAECSLNNSTATVHSGNVSQKTISTCDAAVCGEFFPSRPLIRPRLRFKNKAEDVCGDNCTKEYPWHHSHSPGLFTVQCACTKPKLLGVVVMNEAESLATALNSVLTRFSPLPRTIYYDNACNLAQTVSLRFGWVFNETRFLCDRFHYSGHTCSGVFDPDAYKCADPSKTSTAEAINRLWKNSRTHVRYLAGRNLMPLVYCRSVFINLRALLKETDSDAEIGDKNVYELATKLMPCTCHRCVPSCNDGSVNYFMGGMLGASVSTMGSII